jgi:hypothetical protein
VADISIEERLVHYFLAMGAQQINEKPTSATLTFIIGEQRVNVVVVKSDIFTQSKIIEAILGLGSLRGSSNQLYLAAPRLLGASVDAQVFRSYGVGLLLYDERRIDESVPPQVLQIPQPAPLIASPQPAAIAEFAELRSMYLEMKSSIAELREEMQTYRKTAVEAHVSSGDPQRPAIMPREPVFDGGTGQLPSFFANNPWLDLLSKRGREQGEAYAG